MQLKDNNVGTRAETRPGTGLEGHLLRKLGSTRIEFPGGSVASTNPKEVTTGAFRAQWLILGILLCLWLCIFLTIVALSS